MSYAFKGKIKIGSENLEHNPKFRDKLNSLVESSEYVTYVGWKAGTSYNKLDYFDSFAKRVYIIEVFPPNVAGYEQGRHKNSTIILGNISDYENLIPKEFRELLIWQQGPEHVEMLECKKLIEKMKQHFKKIVIETPNGNYPQGAVGGNEYEKHLSHWNVKDYKSIGFKYSLYDGAKNENNIIGYWENE